MMSAVKEKTAFEHIFLSNHQSSFEHYENQMTHAMNSVKRIMASKDPYSGLSPFDVKKELDQDFPVFQPKTNQNEQMVYEKLTATITSNTIHVSHPSTAAHLHCPPMIPGLAAEAIISGLNPSMDSWDQSGAATMVEQYVMNGLCGMFGLPDGDGVMTSGGTQSNFMGLLLARERAALKFWNWNSKKKGLHPEQHRLKILCSEAAHFSVQQAASILGLGEDSVVLVKADDKYRMCMDDLASCIDDLKQKGDLPFALIGTAGTTDFGSIDPLAEMSSLAIEHGLWFHADAAYGGGLVLSDTHKHKLAGLEKADSITVDFHKMFYQPISCGAFLVKKRESFSFIRHHADYLNPIEDEEDDIPNLVSKSIQTTRRFDALKPFLSFQLVGKEDWEEMIDHTLLVSQKTYELLKKEREFSVYHHPELSTVVFRYIGTGFLTNGQLNQLNYQIREILLKNGEVIIARTKVDGNACLKFTFLNPLTKMSNVEKIIRRMKEIGEDETRRLHDEQT
ncbi:aspartate aminotransferase family protein [Metabacillus idriensis]|uniref:pyridoxal phosphate-dependent decarboxylase family protein n=1 Tax=Metabacillus idriensis TaxID=324768 RepID=UPI00203F8BD0|nr:aspartate aminotransferase family protein [Metabacillus idriensis]MCM3595850.1 aspartate aminotransferase family protein [Metabacillus idriensis]